MNEARATKIAKHKSVFKNMDIFRWYFFEIDVLPQFCTQHCMEFYAFLKREYE